MGRLERLETAMGRPGKACGNHGKIPWEGVGRRGQAWEEVWEGLPMGRPSHGRSAFRDTASLPGEGGGSRTFGSRGGGGILEINNY